MGNEIDVIGNPHFWRDTLSRIPDTSVTGKVTVSWAGRGPSFVEGSIAYFRVRSGNSGWTERSIGPLIRDPQTVTFSRTAGEYEMESYVRSCDGNCGRLDPPRDQCRATFLLKSGLWVSFKFRLPSWDRRSGSPDRKHSLAYSYQPSCDRPNFKLTHCPNPRKGPCTITISSDLPLSPGGNVPKK